MKNAFVGITIGLALLGQARAEDKPPPPPKPAAELARLKPLAGSWSCQGASPAGAMGPGSPEMKYQSTFKVTPSAEGFAWTLAYDQKKSKTHPMHFAGYWTAGWHAAEHKMVFFWVDDTGGVGLQSTGDWAGDELVLTGDGTVMGSKALFRDTFTRKGDKALHWKGELKPGSAPDYVVIGEDDCKK